MRRAILISLAALAVLAGTGAAAPDRPDSLAADPTPLFTRSEPLGPVVRQGDGYGNSGLRSESH